VQQARFPELSPQIPDVYAEGVRRGPEVIAPHALEDLRARQHLAGARQEQGEEVELGARQLERPRAT
jgi:hypothetical protein